eukprot:Hpha_TRINITY_DN3757_c0_g1::TRINITY_DN3757_c0_g1_i1::g.23874::m.23874
MIAASDAALVSMCAGFFFITVSALVLYLRQGDKIRTKDRALDNLQTEIEDALQLQAVMEERLLQREHEPPPAAPAPPLPVQCEAGVQTRPTTESPRQTLGLGRERTPMLGFLNSMHGGGQHSVPGAPLPTATLVPGALSLGPSAGGGVQTSREIRRQTRSVAGRWHRLVKECCGLGSARRRDSFARWVRFTLIARCQRRAYGHASIRQKQPNGVEPTAPPTGLAPGSPASLLAPRVRRLGRSNSPRLGDNSPTTTNSRFEMYSLLASPAPKQNAKFSDGLHQRSSAVADPQGWGPGGLLTAPPPAHKCPLKVEWPA